MRGTSRASLAASRQQLAAVLEGAPAEGGVTGPPAGRTTAAGPEMTQPAGTAAADPDQLGGELLAVAQLLDTAAALRRALTDPSRPARTRADLVAALLDGRVSPAAIEVVTTAVSQRWSAPRDLADAIEQLGVLSTVIAAEQAGGLDETEDELFRFGRIVASNPDLRLALSNPLLAAGRKQDVLDALLTGKVTAQSLRLVSQAAIHPRGRSLDTSLEEFARLAAQRRERLVAEVHVAIGLTAGQRGRLAAALAVVYRHDVHLNIVIDPQVVGGMSVRIGDELIDGSTASRLAELRRAMAA